MAAVEGRSVAEGKTESNGGDEILKQLFFPNFRAIREPKLVYHHI